LDNASEPIGQRLVLLIDWESFTAVKETGFNIFTGLLQRTIKVLKDPKGGRSATGILRNYICGG
jgi:hypothetical protein